MSFIDKPYDPNPNFDSVLVGVTPGALATVSIVAETPANKHAPQITIFDSTAMGAGVGGITNYGGKYTGAGAYTEWAAIGGLKANANEANVYGILTFYTRYDGTLTNSERMRIDELGNIGIGATAFGTNAVGVLELTNKTAPTSSPVDCVQLYCADYGANHACLHLRNEDGDIIKLEQQAKADYNNWTDFGDVVDALVAMGIFDVA